MWPFVDVSLKKQEHGQKRSSLFTIVFCCNALFSRFLRRSTKPREREREREREQCVVKKAS